MRYSDDLIEEVRSRNDIVDVVSGYVKIQKRGGTYFGLCPFHNEKTASFSVTPSKQMYYCFGCGAGGNVFTFLMEYENYTFSEAMQALADRAGIELPKMEETEDGSVVPCCLDHAGDITLGNLFEQSLDEVLASPRAKALYDGFTRHIATEALCRRCGYAVVTKQYRK